jgi:formate dehydrogenase assembly factor FdhD
MLAGIAVLASVGRLSLELAFVVAFVGLVVVTALTAPVHATVPWRERLRWPLLVGAVVFAAFVGLRTFEKFVGSL